MKKFWILISTLLLTGCFGDVGKGILSNTCIKEEVSDQLVNKVTYTSTFKDDVVSKVVIEESFSGDAGVLTTIKKSMNDKNSRMNIINGVTTEIDNSDNAYSVKYTIDYSILDNSDMLSLGLKEKNSELIANLKAQGFECR